MFIDEDKSAFLPSERPAWEKCRQVLRDRRARRIVYPRHDRLSRNRGVYTEVLVEFRDLGIELVEAEGGRVDLSTPEGFSMEVNKCASSELYSLQISTDITAAQQESRSRDSHRD